MKTIIPAVLAVLAALCVVYFVALVSAMIP